MQHRLNVKSPDTHAHAQEMKLFPWFCKNLSTIHFTKQKLHLPNDKLTKKSNCKTWSTAQITQKNVRFPFVCFYFVSFTSEIQNDPRWHSFQMTASQPNTCANLQVSTCILRFQLLALYLTTGGSELQFSTVALACGYRLKLTSKVETTSTVFYSSLMSQSRSKCPWVDHHNLFSLKTQILAET